jgi:hypothetical protein
MAKYEGDDCENYNPQYPEVRNKRSAVPLDQAVELEVPSQMNPASEITGFDPLLESANGSVDAKDEMVKTLSRDKQGLGTGYDYGPKEQSGENQ